MARGHVLTGAVAGTGMCAWAGVLDAPLSVRAGVLALPLLGSLLPDIDSPRSTITRALGPLGWLLHHIAVGTGVALFRLTRTRYDDEHHRDGHRLITHTLIAAVGTGVLTWLLLSLTLPQVPAGWLGMPAWLSGALGDPQQWSWLLGTSLGAGHAVGLLGDGLTVSGVPALWPLRIHGKRWYDLRFPLAFHTDGGVEHSFIYPVLWVVLGCSTLVMIIGWSTLFHLFSMIRGTS